MAKPTVYIPDLWAFALTLLYPEHSTSELVRAGLIHVIARGAEVAPSDMLRAFITVERMKPYPNEGWVAAAEHALHTRHARVFLRSNPPAGGVAS